MWNHWFSRFFWLLLFDPCHYEESEKGGGNSLTHFLPHTPCCFSFSHLFPLSPQFERLEQTKERSSWRTEVINACNVVLVITSEMWESGLSCSNPSTINSYRWKRGWSWRCFDTTLPALLCKSCCSYDNRYFLNIVFIRKGKRFVTRSNTASRSIKGWDHNCKMVYFKNNYCKLRA